MSATESSIVRAGPILSDRELNVCQLAIPNDADARMAVRALKIVGVDAIKTDRQTLFEAYPADSRFTTSWHLLVEIRLRHSQPSASMPWSCVPSI